MSFQRRGDAIQRVGRAAQRATPLLWTSARLVLSRSLVNSRSLGQGQPHQSIASSPTSSHGLLALGVTRIFPVFLSPALEPTCCEEALRGS